MKRNYDMCFIICRVCLNAECCRVKLLASGLTKFHNNFSLQTFELQLSSMHPYLKLHQIQIPPVTINYMHNNWDNDSVSKSLHFWTYQTCFRHNLDIESSSNCLQTIEHTNLEIHAHANKHQIHSVNDYFSNLPVNNQKYQENQLKNKTNVFCD